MTPGDAGAEPLPSGPIGRRLWVGLSRSVTTAVFVQGSTLALNIFAARALSQARFGDFLLLVTTIATLGGIGQLASGYTTTKYLAEFRTRDRARAGRIVAVCTGLAIIGALATGLTLALGSEVVAAAWLRAPHLAPTLSLVACVVPFSVLYGQRAGVLNGLESYSTMAWIGAASGITYLAFGALGVHLGGIDGGVIGIGLSAGLQWLLAERAVAGALRQHGVRPRMSGAMQDAGTVFHFALPASLGGLVSMSAIWVSAAMLVRQPNGSEQLALFGAANSARAMVLFLPQAVSGVGTTLLNNHLGDASRYRRVFRTSVALAFAVAVTGALGMALVGGYVLQIFGRHFDAAGGALHILLFAAVCESSSNTIYQVIQSRAHMWKSAWFIVLPRDGVLMLLACLLTPGWGAVGLAWAYACAWALSLAITSVWTWRLGLGAEPSAETAPHGPR